MKKIPKNKEEAEEMNEKITKAEKINILFKKIETQHSRLKFIKKTKEELSDFKEPVVFLGRRTGQWEFFENATSGWFFFEHSDGTNKVIYLDGRPDYMNYAKKKFKCYMLHEDNAFKLPEKAITGSDFILDMSEKLNSDRLNLEKELGLKKMKVTKELVKTIIMGVALIIGILLLAIFLDVDLSQLAFWKDSAETVVSTTTTTLKSTII